MALATGPHLPREDAGRRNAVSEATASRADVVDELLRRAFAPLRGEALPRPDMRFEPLWMLSRSLSAQCSCTRPHGSAQ